MHNETIEIYSIFFQNFLERSNSEQFLALAAFYQDFSIFLKGFEQRFSSTMGPTPITWSRSCEC
jgi:hypothetical protein